MSTSAAPEQGLQYFARLHERQPSWFQRLTRSTAGLRYLIAVFTYSHFLSEEILRHPEWVDQLLESGSLQRVLTAEQMRDMLEAALARRACRRRSNSRASAAASCCVS